MIRHLGVALAVALADSLWAFYIQAVGAGRPALSGAYSAAIVLCGAFVTLALVRDRRYLVSAVLGAFGGTYLSVRYGA